MLNYDVNLLVTLKFKSITTYISDMKVAAFASKFVNAS